MKKQSYSNHRRYVFSYHFVLGGFIFLIAAGSLVNLAASIGNEDRLYSASLIVCISAVMIANFFYMRRFAKRAQDRAIRVEENFRHYVLTGKPLDNRLHISQVIALRFAPDDEFVFLAKDAAERHLKADEIKKAIKRWKGDYHRV